MTSGNSKEFYVKLLSSSNLYDRLDGWNKIDYLISEGIFKREEILSLINNFQELLYNQDVVVALHAFKLLDKFIALNLIKVDSNLKERIKELVLKPELDSWWVAEELVSKKILSPEDVSEKIDVFLKFLESTGADQIDAWNLAKNLVHDGVVSKCSLKPYARNLLVLLKSSDMHLRFNSWLMASDLIKEGIADANDFREAKDYLLELLKSDYFDDLSRIYEKYATDFIDIMRQVGVINKV
ncbi:hypothetical protein [Sulfuracidifex tepidarius]|uniref:Uncharacterized protein n=1 Tax=Sulfuracidifex tepidarius TaxID=1294262 RepID=A0A510DRG3_9CREN|nr:hypothetical protein [Sulfuracidifex tepidarius]BBG22740.1 hypothetical protein IC006_0024 [Sulfuracidifex tepidarius]BBG25519.1 hypothetical protein IC007_0024 [Sulfuracidifex tepidarius]